MWSYNYFKDKCRYILHYLSAIKLNLLSCQSCVPDGYEKIYPFSYARSSSGNVCLTAGVPPVSGANLKHIKNKQYLVLISSSYLQ